MPDILPGAVVVLDVGPDLALLGHARHEPGVEASGHARRLHRQGLPQVPQQHPQAGEHGTTANRHNSGLCT